MKRILYISGACVTLTLLLVAIASAVAKRGPRFYSDPATLRASSEYDVALGPSKPPAPVDPARLAGCILVTNENSVRFEIPSRPGTGGWIPNYALHRVPATQSLDLPMARFSLQYIGIAYGELPANTTNNSSGIYLPARFYYGDLRPLTSAEVTQAFPGRYDQQLNYRGDFPTVRFFLAIDPTGPAPGLAADSTQTQSPTAIKMLDASVFDARTHRPLSHGYSMQNAPYRGRVFIETSLGLWHSGPVELVVTVASGPVVTYEMKPQPGQRVQCPVGEIHLLAVLPWRSTWSSSGSESGISYLQVPTDPRSTEPGASLIFGFLPSVRGIPAEVECLDQEGNVLTGAGGQTMEYLDYRSVRADSGQIARIRVKYYSRCYRLIFTLPRIPGLPDENRDVPNLFGVRIPYVWVQDEYRLQDLIRSVTQMDFGCDTSVPFPTGFFPKAYRNVTPEDLMADYVRFYPRIWKIRICEVRADRQKQTIRIQKSKLGKAVEWAWRLIP